VDKFPAIMTGFEQTASNLYNGVKATLDTATEKYSALLSYFGEEKTAMEWEEFFSIWAEFIRDYAGEEKRLALIKERQDKENREISRKAQRAAAKQKSPGTPEAPVSDTRSESSQPGEILDNLFDFKKEDASRPEGDRQKSWTKDMLASLKSEEGVREMKLNKELSKKKQEESILLLENVTSQSAMLAGGKPVTVSPKDKRKPRLGAVKEAMPNCKVCGCSDFARHKFRTGTCSRCMHAH